MMASPKMMMVSTTNSDLPRRESSICSFSALMADHDSSGRQHSITMDDILKNMYDTTAATANDMDDGGPHRHQHQHQHPEEESSRSVDEMWKAIVAGGGVGPEMEEGGGGGRVRAVAGEGAQGMTLEDFLTRAGAVREEDVGAASASAGGGVPIGYGQFQVPPPTAVNGGGGGGGGGRVGKRRAVQEAPPLDKATQQKQRRMIKNRESAARSRERKQAYTVELESLVTQLEEENARLVREEAEQKKERFKQLMENLIPIVEKRRPPRVLRRVHSVHW